MGLKQTVEAAHAAIDAEEAPAIKPVNVSGEAQRALAFKLREWSGWDTASLVFGSPRVLSNGEMASDWAACDHIKHEFIVNVDELSLNPNRVLLTVTPFRLRQEAVLTGAMLHEAGHARFTTWKPRNEAQGRTFAHADGDPVTKQEFQLACLMEEPRIEGLMAKASMRIGAQGLDWTMRASAAHLLPMTTLHADPNQKIMDLLSAWALRAGREIALDMQTNHNPRPWVAKFTKLLEDTIVQHLNDLDITNPVGDAEEILDRLTRMICWDGSGRGMEAHKSFMVDAARDVLDLLFPETDSESKPEAGDGCTVASVPDKGEPDDEKPEQEKQAAPPEKGDGDEPEPESDEPESESDEPDEGEPDEQDGEDSSIPDDGEPDEEDEGDDGKGGGQPSDEDSEEDGDGEPEMDTESDLAKALEQIEAQAKDQTEDETEHAAEEALSEVGGSGEGSASTKQGRGDWRQPTKEERMEQKNAEKFLRSLIAPAESSKELLTDTPSSMVDGAALAAWKAGGQSRDPRFFKRIARSVEPSPPVKVAILGDISGSMGILQTPQAVLSWALATSALDLRNFAGRGQQIESCMIHWGDSAEVIHKNGVVVPGIKEVECWDGTSAMQEALKLVEEEMPGFFDMPSDGKIENRLLVQFTDWEFGGYSESITTEWIGRALSAGVNMLTIAPPNYREGGAYSRSCLPRILRACKDQRGRSTVVNYNEMFPDQVWEQAALALA